jgi:hydroxymethylbilane synthase
MATTLRIGTRGSELALFQANAVAAAMQRSAGVLCEIVIIKTSGDHLAEATLSEIGGKRLFVKEIEDALLSGTVDVAVHSSKDMPVDLPPGLMIGAVLPREDPRDAVVLRSEGGHPITMPIEDVIQVLGREPRIGTSSIRRTAQLLRLWPRASFLPVRGNLNTRLRKLDEGGFDALVLASAGLLRLKRQDRISAALPGDVCVPAPGQGIIAIEVRSDSPADLLRHVAGINDVAAETALIAERATVSELGGGCQMPIGAYARLAGDALVMTAAVVSPDGSTAARVESIGDPMRPEELGREIARKLFAAGAGEILANVARAHAAVEGLQP